MTPRTTTGNVKRLEQLQQALAELLTEALKHGFFGTAAIEVTVQDGTIQGIRRRVERIER